MTPTPDPTRHPALELPLDKIRWAQNLMPRPTEGELANLRPRRRHRRTVAAAVTVVGLVGFGVHRASAAPELGPPTHVVVYGDTLWAISRDNGLSVDELLALPGNEPFRANPDLIEIGDRVVIAAPSANEMQRATPDVAAWFDERETCTNGSSSWTCLTWRALVAHLYDAGFRGDDLVTMAAIAPCESSRDPWRKNETHTDRNLATGWLGSYGLFQVRARVEQTGTGGPRDRDALMSSIPHQAAAAFEIYQGGVATEESGITIRPAKMPDGTVQARRPYNRFDPWTCAQIHAHEPFLDDARNAAREIGAL